MQTLFPIPSPENCTRYIPYVEGGSTPQDYGPQKATTSMVTGTLADGVGPHGAKCSLYDGTQAVDAGSPGNTDSAGFLYAVWAFVPNDATNRALFSEYADTNNNVHVFVGSPGPATFTARKRQGGGANNDITGTTPASNQWHHFAYLERAANDRRIYLNGVSDGTTSTSVAAFTSTSLDLGQRFDSGIRWTTEQAHFLSYNTGFSSLAEAESVIKYLASVPPTSGPMVF